MSDPAFAAALRILARRDHLEGELLAKLRRKGFSSDESEAAVARCRDQGYVDDERVGRRFAELRAANRGWGSRRLKAELMKRGMSPEAADRVSRLDDDLNEKALAAALERAERRAPAGWWRLHAARARMVSSVAGRGFATETAVEAVRRLAAKREREHDATDVEHRNPEDVP